MNDRTTFGFNITACQPAPEVDVSTIGEAAEQLVTLVHGDCFYVEAYKFIESVIKTTPHRF